MSDSSPDRRANAAREFNASLHRGDGEQVVTSLCLGLDLLRDQLFFRVHRDVESVYGIDSMLVPVSASKTEQVTKVEIEAFQVASSFLASRELGQCPGDGNRWLPWLTQLRLGDDASPNVQERIDSYLAKQDHERRLAFLDVVSRFAREARYAPLVLFRLYPRAIQIVVAVAFGNAQRAREIRDKQVEILPAIEGCEECRGRLLANGAQCGTCGNPVWTYARMNMDE